MDPQNSAKYRAIALIKDEHRSLAAVVHALQFLTKQALAGEKLSQTLLDAIAHYLLHFPEKKHHPAEDRWLFAPIRQATQEGGEVLDALEAEHAAGDVREQKLMAVLKGFAAAEPGSAENLHAAVEEYAKFYWAHMATEETEVLPLAERVLTEADWEAAVEGFSGNHDPMYGPETNNEFDALFQRIVYLAPSPIGLGGSE
jgi:hemerythrin-like domain-containing protein